MKRIIQFVLAICVVMLSGIVAMYLDLCVKHDVYSTYWLIGAATGMIAMVLINNFFKEKEEP